jgi:hypothetical protein
VLLARDRHGLVELPKHELRVVIERLAVLGRRHAFRRPHEQRLADFLFEASHLLAQGRLRDEDLTRRLREAAALDDLHEIPQLPHVHRCFSIALRMIVVPTVLISHRAKPRAQRGLNRRERRWNCVS